MSDYLTPVWETSFGLRTKCPRCEWDAPVNGKTGCISDFHVTENGILCFFAGRPLTTEAAIARDNRPNPAEQRVIDRLWQWHLNCKGYDRITGDACHHPICQDPLLAVPR
ncbi:hypothetical protein ACFWNE_07755 [Streptomyces goshikiensis]|uniref:hypothetical protein n=1 Tax=Streptomyces goshikiensis TaxID=1942 RepID=UPI003663E64F